MLGQGFPCKPCPFLWYLLGRVLLFDVLQRRIRMSLAIVLYTGDGMPGQFVFHTRENLIITYPPDRANLCALPQLHVPRGVGQILPCCGPHSGGAMDYGGRSLRSCEVELSVEVAGVVA
jgi:hypothetical protein